MKNPLEHLALLFFPPLLLGFLGCTSGARIQFSQQTVVVHQTIQPPQPLPPDPPQSVPKSVKDQGIMTEEGTEEINNNNKEENEADETSSIKTSRPNTPPLSPIHSSTASSVASFNLEAEYSHAENLDTTPPNVVFSRDSTLNNQSDLLPQGPKLLLAGGLNFTLFTSSEKSFFFGLGENKFHQPSTTIQNVNKWTIHGPADSHITALGAGQSHACYVEKSNELNTRSVWCMGKNNQGQLGNNTSRTIKQAVQVQGLPETQEEILLALGSDHSCALIQRSKQVYCWGSHSAGQLGIGKTSDDKALKAVLVGKHQENGVTKDRFNMATQILQISARGQHTCAVVQEPMKQSPGKNQPKQVSFVNRAWCWGKRNQQDLNTLPTLINESPKNVLAIAVGENHVCALEQHGNIFCWGSNPFGQLGTNDQKNRRVPVKITLSQNNPSLLATEIVSGKDHSCALAQGSVYCWGANHQGQTGQNPSQSIILSPQKVEFLGNTVVSLTAGDFHTCAALENGTIRCFGSDQDFEFPGLF